MLVNQLSLLDRPDGFTRCNLLQEFHELWLQFIARALPKNVAASGKNTGLRDLAWI
jgi:hypothetical protein